MKKIILTGASDGLGKEFAQICLKNDIEIVALCRTKPSYKCDFIATDLADEQSIINACNYIKEKHSKFDVLINCAGVIGIEKLEEVTYSSLENVIKINSIAPMFLTTQLMTLIKEDSADILNVGSTVGTKQGYENQLAYTTSKWGLRGTSYNLQLELKKSACRVIQFNVGGMNTKMHEKYNGRKIENLDEWMNPTDIAKFMFYLLNLPKNIEVSEITINRKLYSER